MVKLRIIGGVHPEPRSLGAPRFNLEAQPGG